MTGPNIGQAETATTAYHCYRDLLVTVPWMWGTLVFIVIAQLVTGDAVAPTLLAGGVVTTYVAHRRNAYHTVGRPDPDAIAQSAMWGSLAGATRVVAVFVASVSMTATILPSLLGA